MKKQLLAVAVVSAFAAPAIAQNVTVYGVIDTGIQTHDTGAATEGNATRAVDGVLATSRFGFKGSEDLGGGMTASFALEARLNPSDGSNGSTLFNRNANLTLSAGFGSITIGQGDTGGTQDIDAMVSQAGNLGLRPTLLAAGFTGSGEIGSDVANVVKYTTPSFNGFQASIGYQVNGSADVSDGSDSITDLFLSYVNGPAKFYFGTTKLDASTAASKKDFKALGATYDAGFASFGLTTSSSDASTVAGDGRSKTSVMSAAMPIGNGLKVHGVYATAKKDGVANASGKGMTLALTKALSKRTTVYTAYSASTADSAAQFGMVGQTITNASGMAAGQDGSYFTVGVSHSF